MNCSNQITANIFSTASLKNIKQTAWLLLFLFLSIQGAGQAELSPKEIKKLSVEELMDIEVTLASRTPQKLTEAASAIQVITGEDIRRSGATHIADALRLASNLQVAELNSSSWIISARGFNTLFSNKLLVMIDGRTVYTPLYGGVLWDMQNVLLEDIDHIEVVSGPGGNLWGANAVNGVINIVTKNTKETTGLYASGAAGNFIRDMGAVRYGGKINNAFYKVYGQRFDRNATELPNRVKNNDAWNITQGGFRVDWNDSSKNSFTVQGDYYGGNRKTAIQKSALNGQNLLARWTRDFSPTSAMVLQAYYDRYYTEDAYSGLTDEMNTADLDLQHHFAVEPWQTIVWGVGYRFVKDNVDLNSRAVAGILPKEKRLDLFQAFIQDDFRLAEGLRLTLGTKLLHNVYTGWEWQPSARVAWSRFKSTLWAAASRAVRTPSRFDVDYYLPLTPQPPTSPSVAGGPNFVSEKLLAYELGYRFQPNSLSSFSVSSFYNIYDDLYSVEALPNTLTYQIQNGSEAKSWGAEISGNYQLHKNWRVRGGYTFFKKDIHAKPGRQFNPQYLGNDARHQAVLQSILNLPFNIEFDITARYLDELPSTLALPVAVPAYTTFDARLAYTYKGFEIAVVGQNLAEKKHTEFGNILMPRHVYAKIIARF